MNLYFHKIYQDKKININYYVSICYLPLLCIQYNYFLPLNKWAFFSFCASYNLPPLRS